MVGGGMGTLWICYALLSEVFAGPLHRVPRESEDYQNDLSMYANYTANEVCFSEGEVFQKGDVMPNPGPCEECRCEPPSIVCNMIKCPTNNNGCRTIQRANHCCPDYNCECDYNGQLYNDGERLDLPEEPCQVCYCKGGEVMCNSITCYHRDDCDPIQVAGQCCPKYENCPVRDMGSSSSEDKNVLVRSANKTNYVPPKREMNPWLLTKLPPASSLPPSKTSQDSTTEGGSVIIVSDWLTERRTTTEDAANSDVGRSDYNLEFTDEPDLFTIPDHLTTEMKQDNSSDRSVIMKNLDTITPVDEVIFTRIDGQNESNEVKMEDQSIFSKKNQENITQILAQVNSTISNISDTLDSTTKVSEDLKRNILSASSLEKVPILIFSSETMANYETSTKPTKKIIEPWRNGGVSSLSQEMKVSSTDSTNTQFNIDSRDVKKGVILGNIFGLDGLSLGGIEPETTTKDLLEYHTTVNGESKYDFKELTENSLEEKINEHFKGEKIKISLGDGPNNRTDTTISGTTDKVITISSSTDFSSKTENKNKNEYPTDLAKIKEENSSNSSNEPITPISGRDEATKANTSSQLSNPLDIKSFGDIKTKRNNFNVSRITYDSVKNSTISILFDNKGYTDSPPTAQETLKVLKDDTKLENVVLGYESINTSEVSPNNLDEGSTLPTTVSSVVESISDFESTADTVMELNSLVPFLQLGDHEHDQTTVDGGKNIEVVLIDSNSNATSSIDSNKQSVSQKIEQGSVKNENITTDTTMETVYPTTHLPLRPGDLKVIAEYLINDTIKTIQINNISHYVPDPWLQGNLTSVESMNSILTAANVSIAIMNKTNDKVKRVIPESTTRPIEVTSLENYEKENNLSDNSALNFLKIANKTGHFGGKIEEYSNYPKYNSDQYTLINDEVKSSKTENLENSEIITQLVKSSVEHSISNEKENITSISNLERRFNQGSSDTDRRFDSVNPAGNFEIRQIEKRGFSTKKKTSNVTTASATSSQPQKDQ